MLEKERGKIMDSQSQTERDASDLPVAIFTRSESCELVQLQVVPFPRWIYAELRHNGRFQCQIPPDPTTTWSVHDHTYPTDIVDVLSVELERYYRYEHDRLVVDGALIQDPVLAARFIKFCQRIAGIDRMNEGE